ncbi:MAG TPA: GNAT family N-acetyltransferase [Thermoanaerobaculia bacterium]|nr:GNAT family N-acetyltransferase [Thermoanaerobaculia bacterium]
MSSKPKICAPEHLKDHHDRSGFDCDVPELNDWLKLLAQKNEARGSSRTYVICIEDRVVGYYALATGAITRSAATGKVRRQMPEPIPVMIIGRLAVDSRHQALGLGYGLLRDALLRTLQIAEQTGIRAVLLHAMTGDAKRFYQRAGFQESPLDPMMMMITITDVEKALEKP